MLQVAGHLFIIPTYHNKQWQLLLDYAAAHWRTKWRGERQTKISGGQRKADKEGREWAGDRGKPEV